MAKTSDDWRGATSRIPVVLEDGRRWPSMAALAEALGITPSSLCCRIHRLGSLEAAVAFGGKQIRQKYYRHPGWDNKRVLRADLLRTLVLRIPAIKRVRPYVVTTEGFRQNLNRVETAYAEELKKHSRNDLTDDERGECYFRLEREMKAKVKGM